jgi:uncharacterized UBP type Zn finger protein
VDVYQDQECVRCFLPCFPEENSCRVWCFSCFFSFCFKATCLEILVDLMLKHDDVVPAISMDSSKEEIMTAYFEIQNKIVNLTSVLE